MGKKQEVTYVTGTERHVGFPFHAKSKEDCLVELGITSKEYLSAGLTSAEAAARLAKYGPNRLSEKEKTTLLQRIWHQVNNVLVGVLVFVAIVAGIQAVRYSLDNDSENTVTNAIQVGLILFVILYVHFSICFYSICWVVNCFFSCCFWSIGQHKKNGATSSHEPFSIAFLTLSQ
jgi:magnesium-transporting ATPase (P-type)